MANRRSSIGARLTIDRKDFKAALAGAQSDAKAFTSNLEGMRINNGPLSGKGINFAPWTELHSKVRLVGGAVGKLGGVMKNVFESEASFENIVRGLASTSDGSETLRAELMALKKVAEMPGLGFREAIQGASALKGAGLSALEARNALEGFGNALANAGKGKAELSEVIMSLSQILSTKQVDMENIKEISSRIPGFMELVGGIPKDDAKYWVTQVLEQLKQLPKAATSASDAIDNLRDKADQQMLGLTGNRVAGAMGTVAGQIFNFLNGGAVNPNAVAEAFGDGDVIDKYQPTPEELARRARVKMETDAARERGAKLEKERLEKAEREAKLEKGAPTREAAKRELELTRLRAAGRTKEAEKREREFAQQDRVKQLEEAGMDPTQAKVLVNEQARLEERIRKGRRTTYRGNDGLGFRGLAVNDELKRLSDKGPMTEDWAFPALDAMKRDREARPLKAEIAAKEAGQKAGETPGQKMFNQGIATLTKLLEGIKTAVERTAEENAKRRFEAQAK